MNYVDVAILVILLLFALRGYHSGLVNQLVNLFGFVLALVAAYLFYGKLAPFLREFIPFPEFANPTLEFFTKSFDLEVMYYNAIAFVGIFIGVKLALWLLGAVLNTVAKLPVISTMNNLLGLGVSLLQGFLIVLLLVNFATVLPLESIQEQLAGSGISQKLLEITPGLTEKAYTIWNTMLEQ